MIAEISDKTEWEKLREARTIPSGHFLQSWKWGEFQSSLGRKVFRFSDGDSIAQIMELSLPLGKKYWFCPKGPVVMDNGQWTMDNSFLEDLKNKAKEAGAVFLRIEPCGRGETSGAEALGGLASNFPGAKQSHAINPTATSIVDLTKNEDDLLAAMHPKTRYNIKVAEKHGVVVRGETSGAEALGGLASIMDLFEETAARDGFHLHPREYYEKLIKLADVEIFTAQYEGKLLAAAIVMFDATTATYLHGASSNEMRNLMAPYALHWQIMKTARERGYKRYDMWGISDDPKSSWAGITRFKRGWGGKDISAPGTFDLPIDHFWYSVYRLARHVERLRFYVARRMRPWSNG